VIGRQDASKHFDLTLRGLVGSFLPFLFSALLNAVVLRALLNAPELNPDADIALFNVMPWQSMLIVLGVYGVQIAFAAMILKNMQRMDGLVPFVIASNWLNFYLVAITLILLPLQLDPVITQPVLFCAFLVTLFNIGRLIATLSPTRTVFLLVGQFLGTFIFMAIFLMLFTPSLAT
jgi:hypothetical protein